MINLFRRLFALKFDTPRTTIELMADNHGEKLELLWSRNSSFGSWPVKNTFFLNFQTLTLDCRGNNCPLLMLEINQSDGCKRISP